MDAGTSYALFGTICFDEEIFLNATGFGAPRVFNSEDGLIQIERDQSVAFSIQPWFLLVPKPYNDAVWKFFALWVRKRPQKPSPEFHRMIYREMVDYLMSLIQNGELDAK